MAEVVLVPNPDFSFPMRPQSSPHPSRPSSAHDLNTRSTSSFNAVPSSQTTTNSHRRTGSTLPSFSFNANDASGLKEDGEEEEEEENEEEHCDVAPHTHTQEECAPLAATPSRRGHRRGGSEFVGGDSRLGVSNAVSSSPTKSAAFPPSMDIAGPPTGRRGHAHRRSAAMSSHDVSQIMSSAEVQPRLSTSLPNTPLDFPPPTGHSVTSTPTAPGPESILADPFGPSLESSEERPPSSRRVGFSDNVTIIPRPLSTISSETESSISTLRGHSVNNSISSVLSLSTPSPPSSRLARPLFGATPEEDSKPRTKSSIEISKRVEKEGEWLKSRSSSSLRRPLSESAVDSPTTTFVLPEPPSHSGGAAKKKQSLGHALGFDRRKSEPLIGTSASEPSRLSALSLVESSTRQPPEADEMPPVERVSSTRRIKAWAASVMGRRPREVHQQPPSTSSSIASTRPESVGSDSVPGKVDMVTRPVAETDLDAVFSSQSEFSCPDWSRVPASANVESPTTTPSHLTTSHSRDEMDDPAIMVDLDAALGPLQTPPLGGSFRQRRELHSSRLTRDFNGPGGHYHRRAESAPTLAPFEAKLSTPQQPSMADVFEEDEEEDENEVLPTSKASSVRSGRDDSGIGVQIVDAELSPGPHSVDFDVEEPLHVQRGEWEPERQLAIHPPAGLRLSNVSVDRRGSSIIEETIVEETSPVSEVEIVESHEEPRISSLEPRTSSLTKSSDSSEAPTILGQPTDSLAPPDLESLMTPETYQTSTFSSPDLHRHQGSFDTSRLGTSASSITDNRTTSSCATGDHVHDPRISVDDVPSLTSSRSTMLSTMHANGSRRDISPGHRTPPGGSARVLDTTESAAATRRKRSSIQSLSQLVGGPFGSKLKLDEDAASRPQTSSAGVGTIRAIPKRKEHRLKKLMFWKSKHQHQHCSSMADLAPKPTD